MELSNSSPPRMLRSYPAKDGQDAHPLLRPIASGPNWQQFGGNDAKNEKLEREVANWLVAGVGFGNGCGVQRSRDETFVV